MNRYSFRWFGAAVVGVLFVVGCGVEPGTPAGTDDKAAAAAPLSTTTPIPTLTPTPPRAPTPSPIDTTGWIPHSSDRFGYDMAIPPTWTATPAIRDWSIAEWTEVDPGTDHFHTSGAAYGIGVQAFSAPMPDNISSDEWIAELIPPDATFEGCTPARIAEWEDITVDGQPALFNPDACAASQAFVFVGDRAYVFSVWRGDQQLLLKAFLSTVRLHP